MALKNYPGNWQLTPTTLFWFPLLLMLSVCFAAYAGLYNEASKENKDQQPVKIMNGLLLIILVISCMIGHKTFFTVLLAWAILFLLNDPALELKRIAVLRNLLHSLFSLAAAFTGFCTFGAPMIGFPATWLFVLLTGVFIGGMFSELGLKNNGKFRGNMKTSARNKIICIVLLIAVFVYIDILMLRQTPFHFFFLLTVIPPVLTIWFKPAKTQFILLSLATAYTLLLLSNYN